MTPEEFDRWITAHTGAFPGMLRWLEENPKTMNAFQECLADVTFEDARQATRCMNRGEYESPPFGEHARTVRKLSRTLAYEAELRLRKSLPPASSGPRFNCKFCCDSGIVLIADIYVRGSGASKIKAFLSGEKPWIPECGVFCSCSAGLGRNPQFDERCMFVLSRTRTAAEDAKALAEWMESGGFQKRISVFDAYNSGE